MNNFYLNLLRLACRECSVDYYNLSNKDKIVLEAINNLTEKERNFIEMLKPLYLVNDPNGVVSMRNCRQTRNAFHMNSHHQHEYKKQIKHKLIEKMKSLIS